MMQKIALITGITGQDGSALAELLLSKGYVVHGMVRRSSAPNNHRLDRLLSTEMGAKIRLHFGDLTDFPSIYRILAEVRPDEVYNLAAQSHVAVSFETPEYTANADGLGALRLLEALRHQNLLQCRFYQASTSELYGLVQETPQRETTPFYPRSPYGVAKLYAYWITVNHREAYGMHASNGILFNHEGPTRGEMFVTRKITKSVAKRKLGIESVLKLGNLDAQRDWGDAGEYVRGMYMMLQQDKPDDYVLATGEMHTVREFVERSFACIDVDVTWEGQDVDEIGRDRRSGKVLIEVDKSFFRPAEVDLLLGDASKAERILGWVHEKSFDSIVHDMVAADLDRQQRIVSSGATLGDFV